MKLEIENVSLSIEDTLILENLSLNVDEQEIISLIGPSASGKSSLLARRFGREKYLILSNGLIILKLSQPVL